MSRGMGGGTERSRCCPPCSLHQAQWPIRGRCPKHQPGKVNKWGRREEGQKRKRGTKQGEGEVYRELASKSKAYEKKRAQISALEFKILGTSVYMHLLIYFWLKCDLPASFLFKKNLPIVSNTALCTWKSVRRVDLMLSLLTTKQKQTHRASLVVQWLRIRLPMQGTQVRALVREDPTYRRGTKPMHHNYWACALEPVSHKHWACVPQLLKPELLEPALRNKRSHRDEKITHHN